MRTRSVASIHRMLWAIAAVSVLAVDTGPYAAQDGGDVEEKAAKNFRVHGVQHTFLEAPDFQFGKYSRRSLNASTPSRWLRLEMDFDSEPDWADDVQIRWYVQVEGEKKPFVFAASVMHDNVKRNPRGQRHLAAIFMRPRAVDRYLRSERNLKQIAVQIFQDGKLEDTWPRGWKDRWWEAVTPVEGVLVDVKQTPFNDADGDRYEQTQDSVAQRK